LPESIAYLYGINSPRLRFCRQRIEEEQSLIYCNNTTFGNVSVCREAGKTGKILFWKSKLTAFTSYRLNWNWCTTGLRRIFRAELKEKKRQGAYRFSLSLLSSAWNIDPQRHQRRWIEHGGTKTRNNLLYFLLSLQFIKRSVE
jgi:hypothetical protein